MTKGFRFEFGENFLSKNQIEYFVPYELEVLQQYCGECVAALDCGGVIINSKLLEEIPRNGDSDFWINNETDITELSLYDYYSDAKAVYQMAEAPNFGNNTSLRDYCNAELFSRLFFKYAKIDLSLILRSDIRINFINLSEDINNQKQLISELKQHNLRVPHTKLSSIVKFTASIRNLYYTAYSLSQTLKLLISEKPTLLKNIYDLVTKFLSNPLRDYDKLKQYINKSGDKYYRDINVSNDEPRGCFAVMKSDCGHRYFALSGGYDYDGTKFKAKTKSDNKKAIEKFADNIKLKISYNWAQLNDSTLKYVEGNNPIKYLPVPIMMGSELDLKIAIPEYRCCERKILAHCNCDSKKKFYIRWNPCEKCIPALLDSSGVKNIYACANDYDELKKYNFDITPRLIAVFNK